MLFSCVQNGLQSTLVLLPGATRPKLLKDFKSTIITSAVWINPALFLAGTTEGEILSCALESTETYFGGSLNHTVKPLYTISGNDAVTGIITCLMTAKAGESNFSNANRRVVLAATKNRLLHFIGRDAEDNVDRVFSGYSSGSGIYQTVTTLKIEHSNFNVLSSDSQYASATATVDIQLNIFLCYLYISPSNPNSTFCEKIKLNQFFRLSHKKSY